MQIVKCISTLLQKQFSTSIVLIKNVRWHQTKIQQSRSTVATVQSIEARINASSNSTSHGLFLTYRGENIYFLDIKHSKCIHNINSMCGVYKCKKISSYLKWWLFVQRSELPPLLAPCSESTFPFLVPLYSPPAAPTGLFSPFTSTPSNIDAYRRHWHARIFFCQA
jgi:hypothetical protein